ncbi:MAG TPA: protease [Deltaproteobacteria bacterium]|nr:MAG: protease [Deltaproteobacteria bacterium GWA2_55_82]OGQ64782.1 MAG: protease [Deltaproteobacteria bacterium RIFCSPLOWO2_02_FULL_55_12]OIJ72632.1 MAG: protease [Deltaproteobacteria bacterium GWC2_55_46]HBG47216.1 protease [Deltaproteobacteria bacterium]HCY11960.1 protease [Deltaproteobacteria bacterium]
MTRPEVIAPAGNLASLKAAVDSGADAVYLGFNDATNARNFEGLNFTSSELAEGIKYVRSKGRQFYVAINTFPQGEDFPKWYKAVDSAMEMKADAVIIANVGVLRYARQKYPDATLHLSTQASSSNYESINFYRKHFGIKRVVLPRVLTIEEIKHLKERTEVEIEVFALGGLCINIEGRCYLSSYVTGASTNTEGACSPSRFVRFNSNDDGGMSIALNGMTLNKLGKDESSPYPTCCKGRYTGPDGGYAYIFEEPESLNVLEIIPGLIDAGVAALKIEGRQRTKSYVGAMTRVMREAVDSCWKDRAGYTVRPEWSSKTVATFEGSRQTLGSYLTK